jgi:hypothetical protein
MPATTIPGASFSENSMLILLNILWGKSGRDFMPEK